MLGTTRLVGNQSRGRQMHELLKQLEASKQRELELLAVIKDLRWSMRMLLSGSCTCLTKTPVYTQHKENCTYRLLQEALVRAEVPSQALREHEANVLEELLDTFAFFQTEEGLWLANAIRGMAEERRKK